MVAANGTSHEFSESQYGCGLQSAVSIHNAGGAAVTLVLIEKIKADWPSDFELSSPFNPEPDAYIRKHSIPTPAELLE